MYGTSVGLILVPLLGFAFVMFIQMMIRKYCDKGVDVLYGRGHGVLRLFCIYYDNDENTSCTDTDFILFCPTCEFVTNVETIPPIR